MINGSVPFLLLTIKLMKENEEITIRVTKSEIQYEFSKLLTGPNKDVIADVVINHLAEKEIGLQQLYKALSGIKPTSKHKVLDDVLINITSLYSYKMNKDKTEVSKLMFKGYLPGKVTTINLYKESPILVQFTCIGDDDKEVVVESWVEERHLLPRSSDIIESDKDDMPF